ncbi:HMG box-containing protein C19G7.04 [Porphyridium purpureum]|uniref:HMG box-containing protein C19G7.04 n=1 Tax=Porphyridium purpureum TaxID=35688 RepID=A0A5J4YX84_PORPP|nr:HMG box-containing protein C19G7.04 [Porphyridium purpureum]|eukprot:POR5604..scf209_3
MRRWHVELSCVPSDGDAPYECDMRCAAGGSFQGLAAPSAWVRSLGPARRARSAVSKSMLRVPVCFVAQPPGRGIDRVAYGGSRRGAYQACGVQKRGLWMTGEFGLTGSDWADAAMVADTAMTALSFSAAAMASTVSGSSAQSDKSAARRQPGRLSDNSSLETSTKSVSRVRRRNPASGTSNECRQKQRHAVSSPAGGSVSGSGPRKVKSRSKSPLSGMESRQSDPVNAKAKSKVKQNKGRAKQRIRTKAQVALSRAERGLLMRSFTASAPEDHIFSSGALLARRDGSGSSVTRNHTASTEETSALTDADETYKQDLEIKRPTLLPLASSLGTFLGDSKTVPVFKPSLETGSHTEMFTSAALEFAGDVLPQAEHFGGPNRTHLSQLARNIFVFYDEYVFQNQLRDHTYINWNRRLRSTAGLTRFLEDKRGGSSLRFSVIELSSKVLTSSERLYATLVHELCHAAQWVVDAEYRPPHGAAFMRWVRRCEKIDPALSITTCHNFEIQYRFWWACSQCGEAYGRHSNSIDVRSVACARCSGKLRRTIPNQVRDH